MAKPSFAHLNVFGEGAILKLNSPKLEARGYPAYFVSYTDRGNTHKFHGAAYKKVVLSCDVVFVAKTYKPEEQDCLKNFTSNGNNTLEGNEVVEAFYSIYNPNVNLLGSMCQDRHVRKEERTG